VDNEPDTDSPPKPFRRRERRAFRGHVVVDLKDLPVADRPADPPPADPPADKEGT
jgi:hypothetical protein